MKVNVLKRVFILALVLIMCASFIPATAEAADETYLTLGGTSGDQNAPLRIDVGNMGSMKAYQWQSTEGGSQYIGQYYAENAWGSNIYYTVNGENKHFATPYYYGDGTQLGSGTQRLIDPNTVETVWLQENGSLKITQTVNYLRDQLYYEKRWKFENLSTDKTFSDMTFIHGGDTYFGGDDSSRSYWNPQLGMIYLKGQDMDSYGLMGFAGSALTPADHYFGGYYSQGNNYAADAGQLPDTADSNYIDAGYQLQWDRSSLAPGEAWEIISYERWTEAGFLQIMAPASQTVPVGSTVRYEYIIQSFLESEDDFNLTATSSNGWQTNIIGGNIVTIGGNGASANITVELVVPADASTESDILTLNVASQSDGSLVQTSQVNTSISTNTEPPPPARVKTLGGQVIVDGIVTEYIYHEDYNTFSNLYSFVACNDGNKAEMWLTGPFYKQLCRLNPNADLQVVWKGVSYTLPLKSIDINAEADEFKTNQWGIDVRLSMEKVQDDTVVREAAAAIGAELISEPVEFRVEIDSGFRGKKSIDSYEFYVTRTISLPQDTEADSLNTSCMKFMPETGSFTFTPSIFNTAYGITSITAKYQGNGCFAILKNAKTFKDIENHWGRNSIEMLASRLITRERSENIYAPEEEITRAEFASMLVRALGVTEKKSDIEFGDVGDEWYVNDIMAAVTTGLVNGRNDGNFYPDDSILREEMAAMICRALELAGVKQDAYQSDDVLTKFSDAGSISEYARANAAVCANTGIILGRGNDMFAPKDKATRAEAAAMVERMLRFINFMN